MPSLYTRFVSSALFPLHERLKHHRSVSVRRQMEKMQWWSGAKLVEYRNGQLREFIQRVAARVPYYSNLFAELGLDPRDVRSVADLDALPFLTKTKIRENFDALKATDAAPASVCSTGGSTGEPLKFLLGRERVSHDVAAKWRATRWWGVDIGDAEVVVWGSPIELGAQDRLRALRDRVLRSELIPAFDFTEANLERFIRILKRRKPKMVFGYPSAIARIGRYAIERNYQLRSLGVKVAFVTAEHLYADQKSDIEQAFGCRVANGYGGRDAGFIAHECPEGGLHITADDIVVEIIDSSGSLVKEGTPGEVVITHLRTGDFPFIRYRTGDIASLTGASCSCGRGLPLLGSVQGRSTDFVVAQNGKVMHGLALIYVMRELHGISAFKIIQEEVDRVRVLVVPAAGYDAAVEEAIRHGVRDRLGAGVEVSVELVTQIPPERSGKYRYVVSNVASAQSRPHEAVN